MGRKTCARCKELKDDSEFYKNNKSIDGLSWQCGECQRKYRRKRYYSGKVPKQSLGDTEDEVVYYRLLHRLRNKFKITEQQFRDMQDVQLGMCAICGESLFRPEHHQKNCHIDHCHINGSVRGLLCGSCNSLLGYARDKIWILERAIDYLIDNGVRYGD